MRHWVDHNSVKAYNELNDLRFEVTMNMPGMFKVWRLAQGQPPDGKKKLRKLRKGVSRIEVLDRENGLMGQSNPVCPGAGLPGMKLYYGEIHSHTKLSDGGGLPEDSYTWGISEEGGPLSVRHGLDLGYKFGFTGGTDNHKAEAGNPDLGGITGLYATSLTREDVFDALMSRRTFATNGPRTIIRFSVNNAVMGSDLVMADAPRHLEARFITCDRIAAVDVIRNGTVVYEKKAGGARDFVFEWTDNDPLQDLVLERKVSDDIFAYYYMRVRTVNGNVGWASPVWVALEQ